MNRKSVLVVDDDFDIRTAMCDLIEGEGYPVLSATNGQEGLNTLRASNDVGLVFLDMMMPIKTGREFLDEIRVDEGHCSKTPVVVVSAVADRHCAQGAQAFLRKPPEIDSVLKLVSQYCG